jgi:hypothetical protein
MNAKTGGWVAVGCGVLLLFLSFLVIAFFGYHAFADVGGAISGDEAMPGVAAGCCCAFSSLLIALGGVVAAVRAGRAAGQPPM